MKWSILLAGLSLGQITPPPNQLKIVLAADGIWKMNIDGNIILGEAEESPEMWGKISNYTVPLKGDGPWVVGIEVTKSGESAALFSSIFLNDRPYTATGSNSTKFKALSNAPSNWLDVGYNDKNWATGSAITHGECLVYSMILMNRGLNRINELSPGLPIRGSWYPKCKAYLNSKLFFRVLVSKPKLGERIKI